ncbi:MAG TPA: glycosyltransferase family 9 protein [Planctomycetota bacterium]|nr:glycosyltransferase family 9 protein [Planctomycetota bacterium]
MTDVLVVRRGGLGDTLLMTPLLRALRCLRPGHGLHFAGVREFAGILLQYGVVDRVLSSEDLASWSLGSERGAARERLRRYTHIVSDDPGMLEVANAETTVQTFDPRPGTATPIARQLAEQLGLQPVWPDDAWLMPARLVAVDGPVLLAPGSGSREKCWPRVRWLELARRLMAAGERVQVVVGPAEIERDDPRRWSWPAGVAFVVEREPAMLARQLAEASAFVGNDSGPSHLAAMLAVPTVAIFGPTDPSIWAPVGPHVTVAGGQGRDLAGIGCAEILDALQAHGSRARTLCQ